MAPPLLRIGTRGSPMALAQTNLVRDRLAVAHGALTEPGQIEIVVIKTTGDKVQDRSLAEIGGKGLFTKEIEEALLDKRVDMAVHSVKDVPTWLPKGLELVCFIERSDPRDAFVSLKADGLEALPAGAVIGTASLRRQAQILHRWPRLKVVPFRGNVDTRLRKLAEGQVDATLLGAAGLHRISRPEVIRRLLSPEEMLPAVAQGTIGIEIRADDDRARAWLAPLNHPLTERRIAAERALLAELEGSCRTPIAGLAEIDSTNTLVLRALIAMPDGNALHRTTQQGPAADAARIGTEAGKTLKKMAGKTFFDALL